MDRNFLISDAKSAVPEPVRDAQGRQVSLDSLIAYFRAIGTNSIWTGEAVIYQLQEYVDPTARCAPQPSGEPSEDDFYSSAIVWSQEDQAYLASTPELPGCISDGRSKVEALRELADARAAWIGAAREAGKVIPRPITLDDPVPSVSCAAREALARIIAPGSWEWRDGILGIGEPWAKNSTFPAKDAAWVKNHYGEVTPETVNLWCSNHNSERGKEFRQSLEKADAFLSLPAAGGEASKREAEIVERCAMLAESFSTAEVTSFTAGPNARPELLATNFGRAQCQRIADAIRASLRKDG
jgi:predicted RNase H-like HicB family nuclease